MDQHCARCQSAKQFIFPLNQFRDSSQHTVDSCQRGGVGVAAVFHFRCSVFVAFTHLRDVGQAIEHLPMVRTWRELRQLRDAGVDASFQARAMAAESTWSRCREKVSVWT